MHGQIIIEGGSVDQVYTTIRGRGRARARDRHFEGEAGQQFRGEIRLYP